MPQAVHSQAHQSPAPPPYPWLADASYPKGVDWDAELPKSMTGKVLKAELRRRYTPAQGT